MAALHEAWQKQQQELEGQISGIDQAVSEASSRRQSIAANLARDLVSRYELIFSRRGGTAVVEVAGGICQGCFMNIPPQLGNEIIRSDKIHLCPSCQRIVYVKPAPIGRSQVGVTAWLPSPAKSRLKLARHRRFELGSAARPILHIDRL